MQTDGARLGPLHLPFVDALARHPFVPESYNLSKGWAVAGHYDYMKVGAERVHGTAAERASA